MTPWSECTPHGTTRQVDYSLGGDFGTDLVMADLGSAAKCDMDGAPVLPRCPKELEPFLRKFDGSNGSRPLRCNNITQK